MLRIILLAIAILFLALPASAQQRTYSFQGITEQENTYLQGLLAKQTIDSALGLYLKLAQQSMQQDQAIAVSQQKTLRDQIEAEIKAKAPVEPARSE
jgi:hypothetical protein